MPKLQATQGPRRKPELFHRAIPTRGCASAARGAGRSAGRSASGTCARSKLHHSPLS
jgi:hypothetical protein